MTTQTLPALQDLKIERDEVAPCVDARVLDGIRERSSNAHSAVHFYNDELKNGRSEYDEETARAARDLIEYILDGLDAEDEEIVRKHVAKRANDDLDGIRLHATLAVQSLAHRNRHVQFTLAEREAGEVLDPTDVETENAVEYRFI